MKGCSIGQTWFKLGVALWMASASLCLHAAGPESQVSVEIRAQPLDRALLELSKQASFQLIIDSGVVTAKRSAGLSGTMSIREALDRLLRESNLSYRWSGQHTVTIVPRPGASASDTSAQNAHQMLGMSDAVSMPQTQSRPEESASVNDVPQMATDATQRDKLDEIVVTARRVEEKLQDVPISMSVFNQEQLTSKNIVDATELATYTPSLSASTPFGSNMASFSIRGFTQESHTTPSVAIIFADAVSPRGSGLLGGGDGAGPGSFFDLQNVQVLKGPQGTLFGRNTTGGGILLVPVKPTSEFGGYVEASYGNYNMERIQAVLNAPLGDSARFRLGIDQQKRDGYMDNITGIGASNFDDVSYFTARASLVVDIAHDIENYTIGTYTDSDTNGPMNQGFACDPTSALFGTFACAQLARTQGQVPRYVQNDLPNPDSNLRQWQIINTTTWKATDEVTIKDILAYGQVKTTLQSDLFGTDFMIPSTLFGVPTGSLAGLRFSVADAEPPAGFASNDQSTLSEELRFEGHSANNKLNWQAGGYLEVSEPLGLSAGESFSFLHCANALALQCTDIVSPLFRFPAGTLGSTSYSSEEVTYRDVAGYGQGTYSLTDKLSFTGGLRYTSDRSNASSRDLAYHFVNPANPGFYTVRCLSTTSTPAPDCFKTAREVSSAPTWLVDVDYKPTDDVLLYGKYSRGYRQGAVNALGADGYETFKPEKVDAYEVGAKTSVAGTLKATFNVAAFYNDFTDQQLQVGFVGKPGVPATSGIVNAGKSRIWGTEVESTISPFEDFRLDASYTYLVTKLLSEVPVVLNPEGPYASVQYTANVGGPLRYSPKNKVATTATYRLPVPDSVGNVSLGATYTYTGTQAVRTQDPFGELAGTSLVNLNLNWKSIAGKPFDAALFATNLFDRTYATFVTGGYTIFALEARSLGEPRMYGLRVRWHYGQ